MSQTQSVDIEYQIQALYSLYNFEGIQSQQSPLRLLLISQKNEQNEKTEDSILQFLDDEVFLQIKLHLLDIYFFYLEKLQNEDKITYLNEENIYYLLLLTLKFEINVPQRQIKKFILPIAFKNYLNKEISLKYKSDIKKEKIKLIFKQICSDFDVSDNQIDYSDIEYSDLRYLFNQIQLNPINQSLKNKLKEFQNQMNSINKPNELVSEKDWNQKLSNKKIGQDYSKNEQSGLCIQLAYKSIENSQKLVIQKQQVQQSSSPQHSQNQTEQQNNIQITLNEKIQHSRVKFGKSLIRQQNQEIIISRSSNSMIPLGKDNKIFYNHKFDVRLSKSYNQRILYTGELDYNHEQQGNGIFQQIQANVRYEGQFDQGLQSGQGKQILIKESYEGSFRQGQKQGFIIITDLQSQQKAYATYQYDTLYEKFQDQYQFAEQQQQQKQIEYLIEREIIETKSIVLSEKTLKTLNIGKCLQEKIIDYYLEQMQNHYKQLHKEDIDYIIFNTMDCQNIFSSQLNYVSFDFKNIDNLINIKYQQLINRLLKQLLEKKKNILKKQQDLRQIFAINLSRSHFITIVIENSNIYILNSLQSNLVQLCKILKQTYKKIGIDLFYKSQEYKIQINQQNDFYSCGVHTCYVIHNLIKHYKVPLKYIKFNNTTEEIDDYTKHMKNVILTRSSIHNKRHIL